MKRYIINIVSLFPSVVYAQSAYLHEVLEDEETPEPITILGVVLFVLIIGVIYFVVKKISNASDNREKRKFERKYEELKRQKATIEEGGFVCPFCGKHVLDNNYATMWIILEDGSYTIKLCKYCDSRNQKYEEKYSKYRKKDKEGLPDWFGISFFVFLIAIGIYCLVMGCINGEVLMGIISMVFTPLVVGGILGFVLDFFIKLIWNPEPSKPFEKPSLSHLRECNAIITKNRIKGIN